MSLSQTSLSVFLDETAKDVDLFKSIGKISLSKSELFKYAIWMWEVPEHIKESDFDYLQSKIPALESMVSDFINFTDNTIENLSNDDRVKKIVSEAVGVGVGLKYVSELLKTNPNKFKKIPPAIKGKYLDYSTILNSKKYEVETKGTVSQSYSSFKKDILEKKKNASEEVYLRFGTIAMMKSSDSGEQSNIVIVDDPPQDIPVEKDDTFKTQLFSYATFLSRILDPKFSNDYVTALRRNKISSIRINQNKFYAKYSFEGIDYYGECFDHRLIREHIESLRIENRNVTDIFNRLTEKVGKSKFFIGLDESILHAINLKDQTFLRQYNSQISRESIYKNAFLGKDGVLIVKSVDGSDKQLESLFTEEEVFKRLRLFIDYINGTAHECGYPCTSPGIEGKPCEILTYRELCHVHR
jgi:hypothetical protein